MREITLDDGAVLRYDNGKLILVANGVEFPMDAPPETSKFNCPHCGNTLTIQK